MSGGTRERIAIELGIERLLGDGQDVREGQVAERPLLRQQRGVALDQRRARQRAVAVGEVLAVQGAEVEVLVLEGVRVLVGQRHPLERPEGAAALDDRHLIAVVVVVAEHLVAEQLELDGRQVGAGREEAQPLADARLDGVLLGRRRFGDEALEIGLQAGLVDDPVGHRARGLELADGRHRRLGLGDEGLELGRAEAGRRARAGAGGRDRGRADEAAWSVRATASASGGRSEGLEAAQAATRVAAMSAATGMQGRACWRGVGLASANRRRPGWVSGLPKVSVSSPSPRFDLNRPRVPFLSLEPR